MKEFAKEDDHVTYIGFSRNFGKEAAMYAGFCNVTKDVGITAEIREIALIVYGNISIL